MLEILSSKVTWLVVALFSGTLFTMFCRINVNNSPQTGDSKEEHIEWEKWSPKQRKLNEISSWLMIIFGVVSLMALVALAIV